MGRWGLGRSCPSEPAAFVKSGRTGREGHKDCMNIVKPPTSTTFFMWKLILQTSKFSPLKYFTFLLYSYTYWIPDKGVFMRESVTQMQPICCQYEKVRAGWISQFIRDDVVQMTHHWLGSGKAGLASIRRTHHPLT